MFSALWDLFTCAARALFDLGGAVVRLAFHLLSALAGALLWPLKALWTLLVGDWSTLATWTPAYLAVCLLVLAALAGLLLYSRWKKGKQ